MIYDPHFNFFSELNGREIFIYKYMRVFIDKDHGPNLVYVIDEYGMRHLCNRDDLESPTEEDMSDF